MRPTFLALLMLSMLASTVPAADYLRDADGVASLQLGTCLSALDDQNGDGAWEVLVGAPGYNEGGLDAGRAYLWFGGTELTLNAQVTWEGSSAEKFGHSVARIGDVNDDGVGDWAVGAPLANNTGAEAGRVYIFYGGMPIATEPDLVLEGPNPGGRFGYAITALGDFNGDDVDDFAVGAPWTNTAGLEAGAAFVYYGDNSGPETDPDLTMLGNLAGEHFGWSLAGAAEFLGGSAYCLVVGAPSNATSAGTRQGAVYVFEGSTSTFPGPDETSDLTLQTSHTSAADNEFGFSVAAIGSYDGDGDPDIAVGIPYFSGTGLNVGRVEVFFGGSNADEDSDRYVNGPRANSKFGWSVAGVGEIIDSARPDLIIGSPTDPTLGTDAGRAFILPGGSGNVSDADNLPLVDRGELVEGYAPNDLFGAWVSWAGDMDGDGLDDYMVGAPFANISNFAVAGWVRFIDSSGDAVPAMLGAWSCRWTDDGAVTGSLGLTLPSSDITRIVFTRRDGTTLHDGPPAVGSAAWADGRSLHLVDHDAAYQARGLITYDLTVELDDGTVLAQTALSGPEGSTPSTLVQLAPAHPNPFNPGTNLGFRAMEGQQVVLRIVDLRGRQVRTLHQGAATGSWQTLRWDGRDNQGRNMASGVFLASLRAGTVEKTQRLMLVR